MCNGKAQNIQVVGNLDNENGLISKKTVQKQLLLSTLATVKYLILQKSNLLASSSKW